MQCCYCKEVCHKRRDCPNDPVCYECGKPGHKKGARTVKLLRGCLSRQMRLIVKKKCKVNGYMKKAAKRKVTKKLVKVRPAMKF